MSDATTDQPEMLPKYYCRSRQLSAVLLAVEPLHAAARLIQMMMADRIKGEFDRTIQVSESGREADALEFCTFEVFLVLGLLPITTPRERFENFFFPEGGHDYGNENEG
jgi:hypothetical protein